MKGLIAKKVGMTQIFDESGNLTPVTVIQGRKRKSDTSNRNPGRA